MLRGIAYLPIHPLTSPEGSLKESQPTNSLRAAPEQRNRPTCFSNHPLPLTPPPTPIQAQAQTQAQSAYLPTSLPTYLPTSYLAFPPQLLRSLTLAQLSQRFSFLPSLRKKPFNSLPFPFLPSPIRFHSSRSVSSVDDAGRHSTAQHSTLPYRIAPYCTALRVIQLPTWYREGLRSARSLARLLGKQASKQARRRGYRVLYIELREGRVR